MVTVCELYEQVCEWNAHTFQGAAKGGHLECLKYAHEQGWDWNADSGCLLECLKYAMGMAVNGMS